MPKLIVQNGVLATLDPVLGELTMSVDPALLAKTRQTLVESAGVYPAKDTNFGYFDYFGPTDPATVGVTMGPHDTWKDTDAVVVADPRSHKVLAADVVNADATANTLMVISDLTVAVEAGSRYRLTYFIPYSAAATTTGARWTLNGPSKNFYTMRSIFTTSSSGSVAHSQTDNYLSGNTSGASLLTGNSVLIDAVIHPSASGDVTLHFSSMVASSAITAKAGASVDVIKLS
jgi:hypothetical protein